MRKQSKKKRSTRIVDEETQLTRLRATFVNFRRKLEGALVETEILEPINEEGPLSSPTFNKSDTKQAVDDINEESDKDSVTDDSASKVGRGDSAEDDDENDESLLYKPEIEGKQTSSLVTETVGENDED